MAFSLFGRLRWLGGDGAMDQQRKRHLDYYSFLLHSSGFNRMWPMSHTFWTRFLCISDPQRFGFGLFFVPVMPLWCIHILMVDWEKINKTVQFLHKLITWVFNTTARGNELTAVVLDVIYSNVCGDKRSALVFLFVPLFCQEFGFCFFCLDDVFYLCTEKEI